MKTVEEMKQEFYEQVRDFRSGKRKEYPDAITKPLFVVPGSRDRKYLETVDQDKQWRRNWLFFLYDIDPNEPHSWELLGDCLIEKHVFQTTDKLPEERQGPGGPRTRGPAFTVDLMHAVEEARARYAKEKNISLEEVPDETAVRNLDKAFYERHRKSDGSFLGVDGLITRYREAKPAWEETEKGSLWGDFAKAYKIL